MKYINIITYTIITHMSEKRCIQEFETAILQQISDELQKSQLAFLKSYRQILLDNPQFSFVADAILKLAVKAQDTPKKVLRRLHISAYEKRNKNPPQRYTSIRGKTSHICRQSTMDDVISNDLASGGLLHASSKVTTFGKLPTDAKVQPLQHLADELASEYDSIHEEPDRFIELPVENSTSIHITCDGKAIQTPTADGINTYVYDAVSGVLFAEEPTGDYIGVGQVIDEVVQWFPDH